MIHRRGFLIALSATGLSACVGAPKPAMVTVALKGQPGMNKGPDGTDRPVTVLVLRLKSLGAFNSADYFALQGDPSAALGADLVGLDRIAVAPGASTSKTIGFEPEAPYMGVVALVREPDGRNWRASSPVNPKSKVTKNVTLGPGGLSLG
jgi:type VI secretion system protein VasD